MDKELLQTIDQKIDAVRGDLAQTIIELVNIKSVQGEAVHGAPFGTGPQKVLDTMLEKGREAGFNPVDYNVGVISLAMKDAAPDLGIWLHSDVVPEGLGWNFDPYNAVEYKGCIIGRGATDNKGQMASIFHLLKIFKDLDLEMKYNPALYVGSNEETGMRDMTGVPGNEDARGFLNICEPPKLSLVPDSSFPVAYGGKGSLRVLLRSKTAFKGFTLTAGQNDAPARAAAVFPAQDDFPQELEGCEIAKQTDGSITVTVDTIPVHGTSAKPNGNVVAKICEVLKKIESVCEEDRKIISIFEMIAGDSAGVCLNIATEDDNVMGPVNVRTVCINRKEIYPELELVITYPFCVSYDWIVENLTAAADTLGLELPEILYTKKPYLLDSESETARMLCRVANEVTGEDKPMYIIKGGTYAHFLPNAYAFGMDGSLPPEDFAAGIGGAHGLDETVSLERLQRAMRIYARVLLELNEMDW